MDTKTFRATFREDYLNKFVDEIKDHWSKDSKINASNLVSAELETLSLHSKYMNYLTSTKRNAYKLEQYYNTLKGKKLKYYRGKLPKHELDLENWQPFQYTIKSKSELDDVILYDEDMNLVVSLIAINNIAMNYCESVLYAIKQRTWQIKNIIEVRKFEAGV